MDVEAMRAREAGLFVQVSYLVRCCGYLEHVNAPANDIAWRILVIQTHLGNATDDSFA